MANPPTMQDAIRAAHPAAGPGSNSGHGHVWPRPDGVRARCGGPGMCANCRSDEQKWGRQADEPLPRASEALEMSESATGAAASADLRRCNAAIRGAAAKGRTEASVGGALHPAARDTLIGMGYRVEHVSSPKPGDDCTCIRWGGGA